MRLKTNPPKDRVRFHDRENAMSFMWVVVYHVYNSRGHDAMLTSGDDGDHSEQSSHYRQEAVDFRTHGLSANEKVSMLADLQNRLGPDFQVLHESVGKPSEHFHIQYKPRRS